MENDEYLKNLRDLLNQSTSELTSVEPNMSTNQDMEIPSQQSKVPITEIPESVEAPTTEIPKSADKLSKVLTEAANKPIPPVEVDESVTEEPDDYIPMSDEETRQYQAPRLDAINKLLNRLNTAASKFDAANPYVQLNPVKPGVELETDEVSKLKNELAGEAAKRRANQMDKLKEMDILSKIQERKKGKKKDQSPMFRTLAGQVVKIDPKTQTVEPVYTSPFTEQRLDIQKGRESRLTDKTKWQMKEKDEPSDKQVETITQLDKGVSIIDDIKNLYDTTNVKDNLGLYASKGEQSKKYVPFMEQDPDFVKMQQLVGIQLADYVKAISGAAVSEQEAQRLLKNIPNITDKPGEFKTKLGTFDRLLNEYRGKTVKNIKKQGKDVSPFEQKPKQESKKPKMVTIRRKEDGKTKLVPSNNLSKYLTYGSGDVFEEVK